jgi:hypothetical protein
MRGSGARLREPRLGGWAQPASEAENRTAAAMTANFMLTVSLHGRYGVPVGDHVSQLFQAVRARSRLMITRTGKPGRMVRVG